MRAILPASCPSVALLPPHGKPYMELLGQLERLLLPLTGETFSPVQGLKPLNNCLRGIQAIKVIYIVINKVALADSWSQNALPPFRGLWSQAGTGVWLVEQRGEEFSMLTCLSSTPREEKQWLCEGASWVGNEVWGKEMSPEPLGPKTPGRKATESCVSSAQGLLPP